MSVPSVRLPSRLPVGTRFVVEGEDAAGGGTRIVSRYLIYPNGTRLDLMAGGPRVIVCCTHRTAGAARHRRSAQHREERVALQLQ